MIEIGDTLVSLDLAERYFCCDLDACHGACCVEGDSGAPVTAAEEEELKRLVGVVDPWLMPECRERIREAGVAYTDADGDRVTQLWQGRQCVFATRGDAGLADGPCLCAVDCAKRAGLCSFRKPSSCHLYPVRLTETPLHTLVNYHRWEICRPAEENGRRLGVRLWQFLKEPLTERFGEDWYAALDLACRQWLEQTEKPTR